MTHRMAPSRSLRCRLFGHDWRHTLEAGPLGTRSGIRCFRSSCGQWLASVPTPGPREKTRTS